MDKPARIDEPVKMDGLAGLDKSVKVGEINHSLNSENGSTNLNSGEKNITLNTKMKDLIQGLPGNLRSELQTMEDKKLKELAGKMAVQYIQNVQAKSLNSDPVILWDTIKGQIFSVLKSFRQLKECHCVF